MKKSKLAFYGDLYIKDSLTRNAFEKDTWNIINLEAPLTNTSERFPGKVNLNMDPQIIADSFRDLSVIFSLGNNHILDCNKQGFKDTIEYLDKQGIKYFGAGSHQSLANNPLILYHEGKRIALINLVSKFTTPVFAKGEEPGVLDVSYLDDVLIRAKELKSDRIVLIVHWGAEEVFMPAPYDVNFAHMAIDRGVDLIIGHHAHRRQSVEKYMGKYIFYGLGNYAFASLDEASYFDETGKSTKRFKKVNYKWNKKSIKVIWDIESGDVECSNLLFSEKSVVIAQRKKLAITPTWLLESKMYSFIFRVVFIYSKIQINFFNFIRNPKLPRRRTLVSVLRIFTRKEFK